jgi:choline dehydrogenase-like flavoprotein
MQIKENLKEYDVIIVGSGAGGGMATKILSEAGLSIAIVEAGPYFDPANPDQMTQMKWAYDSPRRGRGTTRPFGDFDQAYGGWDIEGEPYSQVGETQFRWFRSRMLGGKNQPLGKNIFEIWT